MTADRLAAITAPLFVPGHRPDRFAKAAASGADAVILDLEDAVPTGDKEAARNALAADFTDLPVIVRINPAGTPWHEADLAAAAALPIAGIMLPKTERIDDVVRIARVHSIVALIETVRGLADVRALAAGGSIARLAFGSIDFAADLGCAHEREALLAARSELVFASRLAGLAPPLDGVTTAIDDADAVRQDTLYARALGFGGKLAIHPRQVAVIRDGFFPQADELDWARRVLASGAGAVTVDGAMVDEPVRIRARALLDRAGA